jgi:hypothetical protein
MPTNNSIAHEVTLDGEVTRELTVEELEQKEQDLLEINRLKAEEQAKAIVRETALAKLAALGLTQEEIDAL